MDIDARAIEALARRLTVRFTDGEPKQTVQVEGFSPVYFSNLPEERSENLPGGGCGANLREYYRNPNEPYEPLMNAFLVWLGERRSSLSMIDVGALWGHASLVAASVFKTADIHLFEMNPFVTAILKRSLSLNGHLDARFHVTNALVSKHDGETPVTFRHFTARYGAGEGGINLSRTKMIRENLKSKLRKITGRAGKGEYLTRQMKIVTLDTHCRETGFVPNLVKLDVEGSEYNILRGSETILRQHHPLLLVELHAPDSANYIQVPNHELIQFVKNCGYRCLWGDHRLRDARLKLVENDIGEEVETNSLGIFF